MKPRNEKILTDGFTLNKNKTYQYYLSANDMGIYTTFEEKGNYIVKNEIIELKRRANNGYSIS